MRSRWLHAREISLRDRRLCKSNNEAQGLAGHLCDNDRAGRTEAVPAPDAESSLGVHVPPGGAEKAGLGIT